MLDPDFPRGRNSKPAGTGDPAAEVVVLPPTPEQIRRRKLWRIAGAAASVLIFALSIFILGRTLANLDFADFRAAIRSTSAEQIALALALTAGSYVALTGYDALALRHLRQKVRYRVTSLASFTSFSISFTLGFPLITGGTVRYWIYSRHGLGVGNVARITIIGGVSFWLGMGIVLGAGLVFQPDLVAELNGLKVSINFLIGLAVLGAILAYFVWTAPGTRLVTMQGFRLQLPGLWVTSGQTVLGVVDVSLAAGVLYVLLPPGHGVDFLSFAAIYSLAVILGIASHAPGGIGVFEATMLRAIPAPSQEALLASLLLFRIFYYLAPFILALALLGANESIRRWRSTREIIERGDGS